jgi:hypothetical protein
VFSHEDGAAQRKPALGVRNDLEDIELDDQDIDVVAPAFVAGEHPRLPAVHPPGCRENIPDQLLARTECGDTTCSALAHEHAKLLPDSGKGASKIAVNLAVHGAPGAPPSAGHAVSVTLGIAHDRDAAKQSTGGVSCCRLHSLWRFTLQTFRRPV